MAYTTNYTINTFAGDFTNEIIASSILDARTIKEGYVTIHPNVDQNAAMVTLDTNVSVQNGEAEFNPDGSTSYSEIKFDLQKFMINAEMDYSGLDNFWLASQQPRGRAGDFEAPASLTDALLLHHSSKMALFVNSAIWKGSALAISDLSGVSGAAGLTEEVVGLIDTMIADSGVTKLGSAQTYKQDADFSVAADTVISVVSTADYAVGDKVTLNAISDGALDSNDGKTFSITSIDVNGTDFTIGLDTQAAGGAFTGTVTVVNRNTVVDALEALYANIDDRIRLMPDTAIYMNARSAAAYQFAQAEAAFSPSVYSQDYQLSFLSIPIYVVPECRDNFIGVSRVSNLHFATPLVSDLNNVLITNMAETTADRLVRLRLDVAFDVAISNGDTCTILH